jgi:hypothetical protein
MFPSAPCLINFLPLTAGDLIAYKKTSKVIVLNILTFVFVIGGGKTKDSELNRRNNSPEFNLPLIINESKALLYTPH